jgi:hypothetical protein
MNNHNSDERTARLEGISERSLVEISELRTDTRELRVDMHDTRAELRSEIQDLRREHRQDFRFLVGLQLTTTVALITVMAKGFGWL